MLRNMFWVSATLFVAAIASLDTSSAAQTVLSGGTPVTATSPNLSGEFDAALRKLSAESYTERKEATKQIEEMLAHLSARLVFTDDPEAQGHLVEIIQFNGGLSAWLTTTLALPPERRDTVLKWGFQPEHLLPVARACSPLPENRIHAAHDLAKIQDHESAVMLATLLRENNRDVHLAAMDAAWDIPPTPEAVDALWDRAVLGAIEQFRVRRATPPPVQFHGQVLRPALYFNDDALRIQDYDLATDMLVHYNSTLVSDKIVALLQNELALPQASLQYPLFHQVSAARNLEYLMLKCPSKKSIRMLYEIATLDRMGGEHGTKTVRWNTRIEAIFIVATLTHQDLTPYQFRKVELFPDTMGLADEDAEKAAVNKLTTWWASHRGEYEDDAAISPSSRSTEGMDAGTVPAQKGK